jgi:hypothetical protein
VTLEHSSRLTINPLIKINISSALLTVVPRLSKDFTAGSMDRHEAVVGNNPS